MTIASTYRQLKEALVPSYGDREAQNVARIVFADAFAVRNVLREDDLSPEQARRLASIRARLLAGEPVQYVLGQAHFMGFDLIVNEAVLIPRPETEELVHWVLDSIQSGMIRGGAPVLDVGTGSGCIALALGARHPETPLWGMDRSQAALEVAERNADRLGIELRLFRDDVLEPRRPQRWPRVYMMISNPPYIPLSERSQVSSRVLRHEPEEALFVPSEDPCCFYRAILRMARRKLFEGGWVFFEVNAFWADQVKQLLRAEHFQNIQLKADLQGKARMLRAQKPLPA